jgi:protein maelstrom
MNCFSYQFPDIENEVFYFISCNYFCETLQGDIFPAEIGMAKYNLKDGVHDSIHMFVNPGKLPLGTSNDAHEHSAKTHQLPIPPGTYRFSYL